MKNFTASKTRLLTASWLGVPLVFCAGAIYVLHAPRGSWSLWQLIFLALTFLSAGFPISRMLFPHRHPVYRALAAHGDARLIAEKLNAEMVQIYEEQGPFYFTASFLVYSPGYTLSVLPYDAISSALQRKPVGEDDGPVIVVQTKDGRTYEWYRTLFQGIFEADQVLVSIRKRANLTRQIGSAYYPPSAT